MNKLDRHKFWLAVGLCVAGVALLFVGMLVNPVGVINPSVIGGAGELFLTAGAVLGIDAIYSKKLTDIVKEFSKQDEESQKAG